MQRVAATFDDAIEACLRETVGAVLVADAALLPRARRAVDLATAAPRAAAAGAAAAAPTPGGLSWGADCRKTKSGC